MTCRVPGRGNQRLMIGGEWNWLAIWLFGWLAGWLAAAGRVRAVLGGGFGLWGWRVEGGG